MKKINKLIILGMLALGVTGGAVVNQSVNAKASTSVTIDGKMSDWDSANLTEGYNGYTALASQGKYVDVYVKMKNGQVPGYGDYNFKIDGKTYYVWSSNIPSSVSSGSVKSFTLTGGKWNDGTQYGTVGTGYVTNDGHHNYAEFQVDLTKLGLTSTASGKKITMANPNIGSDSATTTAGTITDSTSTSSASSSSAASSSSTASSSTSSSTATSSTSTTSSSAAVSSNGVVSDKSDSASKASSTTNNDANNDNDNLNITIDGKFNDWKNVSLTEGYNGYTAMVSDGKYVYVYVKMKYGQVPGYGDYNFDISGQNYYVWSGDMPSSQADGAVKAVSFTGGKWNEGSQYGTVGNGYVAQDGSHSVAEFKVDLSKFNLSTMTGQTITMYNPNIGDKKVTVAGGSTGPYLISGVGVVIVAWGYFKLRKRHQLKPTDTPKIQK
ncbi:Firmicu-CTERM sorting domain-containing protein [Lactiplantibacillus pentosus]|uniref:Firmicu-CTERM sorting domain-containing protein n=1 Tax=Lactiplantibacillus pentosus TaxID=1589 RepID=UPI000D016F52|nr:Firmicu-CTERM sorting domain-containing protein [Lactiplantibacillus pentosus]AYG37683.1 Firmicu-CTERM sorting domain-containing protein [Lactiplantibacillus pentosus]AYG40340.1 Firmicu-CTERM sorting domain-containing protein [Lactiplantibacillus pentosus]MCJ8182276.1 Firmicu-CTERM sorting domain-containing protein [Lactiplantibacillus pentosus]MCT3308023.1 Firmicu-CTERM sorting domain-containing protein [Lactiplantibacillus pentosus]PRO86672.1 Firmicu-CTERM sorting domain-containing protei